MKKPRYVAGERYCSVGIHQLGKHTREQISLIDEIHEGDPRYYEVRRLVSNIALLFDLAAEMAETREAEKQARKRSAK